MKFDPIRKEVFTDTGEFIKQMNCPYKMSWNKLEATNSSHRKCSKCDHLIVDTKHLSDDELLNEVRANANTCLKIDLHQHNIKVISNGILGQKK